MDLFDRFLAQVGLLQSVWMPFAVIIAVVSAAIWRMMDWKFRATVDGLEHRLKFKDDLIAHLERNRERSAGAPQGLNPGLNPKSLSRPLPEGGEKIFVEEGATLKYLSGLYRNRTHIQGDQLASSYLGKWIKVSGKVAVATPFGGVASTLSLALDRERDGFSSAYMLFPRDRERLAALAPEDAITAVGRIKAFDQSEVQLQECELVAVD